MIEELTTLMRDLFKEPDLTVSRETTADDVEGWDSLTHIELIIAVEKGFGVRFRTAEIARLRNVGDLADLIEKKKNR